MLVLEMKKLEYPDEREWADSVLQLAMANNKEIFEQMKGEEFMCQALRELMADEIDEELAEAEASGASKERSALLEIIKRLRNGESEENLRCAGYDAETLHAVKMALQV